MLLQLKEGQYVVSQRFFNEVHEDDEAATGKRADIDRRACPEGYEQRLAHPEGSYQLPHEDPYRFEDEPSPDEVYGEEEHI